MMNNDQINQEMQRIGALAIPDSDKAQLRELLFQRVEAMQAEEKSQQATTYSGGEKVAYQTGPDPDSFRWFNQYATSFIPTFIAAKEVNKKYTLCQGEIKGITVRKLVAGDFAFLASIVPRAIAHLKDDKSIFHPVTGEPNLLPLLIGIIRKALEDWDYRNHCPTGFALEVLGSLVTLFRYKDKRTGAVVESTFTIDDLLNSDPEEVVELVMGVYRANVGFFTKIANSNSVIRSGITILGSIFSNIKKDLKGMVELSMQMVAPTTTTTQLEEEPVGSGGRKRGGKTNSLPSTEEVKDT